MIAFSLEMHDDVAISVVNALRKRGLEMRKSMYTDIRHNGIGVQSAADSLERQRCEHWDRADGNDEPTS